MPVTRYVWDVRNDSYLMEKDGIGQTTAVYTNKPVPYGHIISQRRNGQTRYHRYDGQQSTRQLTDENQNVTDTATYTAFGKTVSKTGSSVNPFGYKGALGYYADPELGSFYERMRPYSPKTGRWLANDPQSVVAINAYTFAFDLDEGDVAYCETILRHIWAVWKRTHPCAADLLRGFLFGRPDPCPKSCKTALQRRGLNFVEGCIRNSIRGGGQQLFRSNGLGVCGMNIRPKFDLYGCHDFQGSTVKDWLKAVVGTEGELGFGIGCMQWHASVTCQLDCANPNEQGCCKCNGICGYTFTLRDTYDFCSTAPKNPKYHPARCACLLEKQKKGKVYNVRCTLNMFGKPRIGKYEACGCFFQDRVLNPRCNDTRSAPRGIPLREHTCEGCNIESDGIIPPLFK